MKPSLSSHPGRAILQTLLAALSLTLFLTPLPTRAQEGLGGPPAPEPTETAANPAPPVPVPSQPVPIPSSEETAPTPAAPVPTATTATNTTNATVIRTRRPLPPAPPAPSATPATPTVIRTPPSPRTTPITNPAPNPNFPSLPPSPQPGNLQRVTPAPAPITTAAAPADPASTTPALPGDFILLKNADLEPVFTEYSKRTGKSIIAPSNLKVQINIDTTGGIDLTPEDVVLAIEAALSLNGIALVPMGDKFMKAVPATLAPQEGAPLSFATADELPNAEQFITQVIPLKVAIPSEIAQLLAQFSKSPQGIVPIDSSQILVVRDTASTIKRMLQLVEKVDVEPKSEYNLEVVPIRYGRVLDIFDTMNSLISGSGGGSGQSRSASGLAGGALSRRASGSSGFGSMGGSRSGSRSAYGTGGYGGAYGPGGSYGGSSGGAYGQGGAYGNRLGSGTYGTQAGSVIPTAGQAAAGGATAATTFQQRLNQISAGGAQGQPTQVLGDARIVPDERSNSLIVYANRQDMQMITNIVDKVDVLLAQVLIEGIVVSVAIGDQQELSVNWYQTRKQFGNDFTGAGAINNGFFGFLTNATPAASPSGFSYWGRIGDDINVAVSAIASDSKVRVLQRPRIQTSHAVPGSFFSGSTVPYVTGFYDYGGYGGTGLSTRSQVQQMEVGVNLEVTPYITPDGLVVLDIYQDISQLGEYVKIDNNDVPTTTSRNASATLSVRDGETIMLGGYIEDNRTSAKSGVPILKDIPGLGFFFRSSREKNGRAELILLMKVTVLKTPSDASALATRERGRLPTLNKAQKEFEKLEDPLPR